MHSDLSPGMAWAQRTESRFPGSGSNRHRVSQREMGGVRHARFEKPALEKLTRQGRRVIRMRNLESSFQDDLAVSHELSPRLTGFVPRMSDDQLAGSGALRVVDLYDHLIGGEIIRHRRDKDLSGDRFEQPARRALVRRRHRADRIRIEYGQVERVSVARAILQLAQLRVGGSQVEAEDCGSHASDRAGFQEVSAGGFMVKPPRRTSQEMMQRLCPNGGFC